LGVVEPVGIAVDAYIAQNFTPRKCAGVFPIDETFLNQA